MGQPDVLHLGEGESVQITTPGYQRLLAQVHPQLEEQVAVLGQRLLERVDLIQLRFELGVGRLAIHPLKQRIRVPGAEEQTDVTPRREVPPESPVVRAGRLGYRRIAEGPRGDPARVHPLVEQVGELALTGPVHPREHHGHRKISFTEVRLGLQQLLAQLVGSPLVLGSTHRSAGLRGLEQGVGFVERRDAV